MGILNFNRLSSAIGVLGGLKSNAITIDDLKMLVACKSIEQAYNHLCDKSVYIDRKAKTLDEMELSLANYYQILVEHLLRFLKNKEFDFLRINLLEKDLLIIKRFLRNIYYKREEKYINKELGKFAYLKATEISDISQILISIQQPILRNLIKRIANKAEAFSQKLDHLDTSGENIEQIEMELDRFFYQMLWDAAQKFSQKIITFINYLISYKMIHWFLILKFYRKQSVNQIYHTMIFTKFFTTDDFWRIAELNDIKKIIENIRDKPYSNIFKDNIANIDNIADFEKYLRLYLNTVIEDNKMSTSPFDFYNFVYFILKQRFIIADVKRILKAKQFGLSITDTKQNTIFLISD
ncbi:MAG: hypothetical protein DRH57_06810 [Candidatus Cloacimonadota bacterium]|nr:MAG: hypothetical protein DRH57_06810 [Candidatus Cloacimonadota bacterium]